MRTRGVCRIIERHAWACQARLLHGPAAVFYDLGKTVDAHELQRLLVALIPVLLDALGQFLRCDTGALNESYMQS